MTTTRPPSRPTWPSWPAWPSLQAVQHASGLLLSLFLGLHLFNQVVAAFGAEAYDALQRTLRPLYQQPVVELLAVVGALAVHLVASIVVAWRRPPPRAPLPPLRRWHRRAGRFLAVVVLCHVVATRGPSLLWGEYPGFHGVAFTMLAWPAAFIPWYLLLGVAGTVHGGLGVVIALPRLLGIGAGVERRRALPLALALACLAVVGGVLAFAGVGVVTDIDLDVAAIARSGFARRLMALGFPAP